MKYVIISKGNNEYVPLTIVVNILDCETSLNPIEEQEKEIIRSFGQQLSNCEVSVYTEKEFQEETQRLIKINENLKG